MRILHTADWHIGKKLGRVDRLPEAERALDEIVEMARSERVDLVIVAGDLFDRALPPFACMGLVFETLQRLADTGAHVVAIPGNHDSVELFRVLAPYFAPANIRLAHKVQRPEEGGVVSVPARDGRTRAQVALFPFLHEAQTVDFMDAGEQWYKSYADRVRAINAYYGHWMAGRSDSSTVDVLVGHFIVEGAIPSGSERALHIGEAFMASSQSLPPAIAYAALGHIHLCQEAPGSAVPAWYSGSLLQLDFGEIDQDKAVLLVEATPGRPARVERVPISSGRKLMRVGGTIAELRQRAGDFGDAILDVAVVTDGPVAGLADEVRDFLPSALYVRADYERTFERNDNEGRRLDELYSVYYQQRQGVAPKDELMEAFRELCAASGVDW